MCWPFAFNVLVEAQVERAKQRESGRRNMVTNADTMPYYIPRQAKIPAWRGVSEYIRDYGEIEQ